MFRQPAQKFKNKTLTPLQKEFHMKGVFCSDVVFGNIRKAVESSDKRLNNIVFYLLYMYILKALNTVFRCFLFTSLFKTTAF